MIEVAVQQRCTTHAYAAKGAGAVLTVGTDWWLAAQARVITRQIHRRLGTLTAH